MSRKGTIIIAVLVNACLLIMLFITATTTEEEILLESTAMIHPSSSRQDMALQKPLFDEPSQVITSHSIEPITTQPEKESADLLQKPEEQVVVQTSDKVIHKLPKIEGAKVENKTAVAQKDPVEKSIESIPQPCVKVVVKKGDTLEKIAKTHGSTVKQIIAFNRLPSTFLRIGQVLNIPRGSSKNVSTSENSIKAPKDAYYVVKPGDNPWTIAMKHHMKVNDLLKLNHLDEKKAKRLKPGDQLRIR